MATDPLSSLIKVCIENAPPGIVGYLSGGLSILVYQKYFSNGKSKYKFPAELTALLKHDFVDEKVCFERGDKVTGNIANLTKQLEKQDNIQTSFGNTLNLLDKKLGAIIIHLDIKCDF